MTRVLIEQWIRVPSWNLTVSHHSLQVSAIALCPDSRLQMRISTVRAVPLGLPSIQHMSCGTIILACTAHPLMLHNPSPLVPEAVRTTSPRDATYATTPWSTTWNWHKGWTHNDAKATEASQDVVKSTPWQCTANIDELQFHDPWRTPRNPQKNSHTILGVLRRATRSLPFRI